MCIRALIALIQIYLGSIRFDSDWIRFDCIHLDSAGFIWIRFDSDGFDWILFGSVEFDSIRLGNEERIGRTAALSRSIHLLLHPYTYLYTSSIHIYFVCICHLTGRFLSSKIKKKIQEAFPFVTKIKNPFFFFVSVRMGWDGLG